MQEQNCISLLHSQFETSPFPHLSCPLVLQHSTDIHLHDWFETTNEWSLTEADFYTQYEFVLSKESLPENLGCLLDPKTIGIIKLAFQEKFQTQSLETVSIVAHKLVDTHTIGIHNDHINGEETHRLVIQINPYWDSSKGGFLMLFNSPDPNDVSKIVQPISNSAFGFEISEKSFHAVSTVRNFSRYSVVYTFKEHRE